MSEAILIAAEDVDDADVVHELLRREFDNLAVSTDPDQAVADFERHEPAVLVLAFTSLARAQAYYLGLYRLSSKVHEIPHRTLLLCNKSELEEVYRLCKKGYYSNYVLFWPLGYDSTRLAMEVFHSLEQLARQNGSGPGLNQFAAQARRVSGLEEMLEQGLAKGDAFIGSASESVQRASTDIKVALALISDRLQSLSEREGDAASLSSTIESLLEDIERLRTDRIETHLDRAVEPAHRWAQEMRRELQPRMASIRELERLGKEVRPQLLVVDDDEFQHRVVRQLLDESKLELAFVTSGKEAVAELHRRTPDLILMDFKLPDLDGVEMVRRIRSVKKFSSVPILMITGHAERELVIESRKAGARGFVLKPLHKQILNRKIGEFLHIDLL